MTAPDHYERLGVARDADTDTIREAYRRLARRYHPDASAGDAASMAAINEAHRVLADPARRAVYDASLRGAPTGERAAPADPARDSAEPPPPMPRAFADVRVPWKLVAVVFVLAVAGVVALSQWSDPPAEPRPDGIVTEGGCVTIDAGNFAQDAVCTGDPAVDVVVVELVPLDGACPFGTAGHQDRQGLGIVCVATGSPSRT